MHARNNLTACQRTLIRHTVGATLASAARAAVDSALQGQSKFEMWLTARDASNRAAYVASRSEQIERRALDILERRWRDSEDPILRGLST